MVKLFNLFLFCCVIFKIQAMEEEHINDENVNEAWEKQIIKDATEAMKEIKIKAKKKLNEFEILPDILSKDLRKNISTIKAFRKGNLYILQDCNSKQWITISPSFKREENIAYKDTFEKTCKIIGELNQFVKDFPRIDNDEDYDKDLIKEINKFEDFICDNDLIDGFTPTEENIQIELSKASNDLISDLSENPSKEEIKEFLHAATEGGYRIGKIVKNHKLAVARLSAKTQSANKSFEMLWKEHIEKVKKTRTEYQAIFFENKPQVLMGALVSAKKLLSDENNKA